MVRKWLGVARGISRDSQGARMWFGAGGSEVVRERFGLARVVFLSLFVLEDASNSRGLLSQSFLDCFA